MSIVEDPLKFNWEEEDQSRYADPDFEERGLSQQTNEIIEGERVKGFDTTNPYAGKNLNMDDLFYNNEEVISSIRKYYFDRDKTPNNKNVEDLVNEFRTDMRWMESNEVSAATTLYYLNNTSQEAVNNFRNAYDAFKAMPKFYEQGTVDETAGERAFRFGEGVFDYVASTVASPTGVLSLFTGGAGTAAKQAASRAFMTKAIERASRQQLFNKIQRKGMLTGAAKAGFVDMVGGVATNTATQFTRQRIGAQDDFDYGQLALVGTASALPGGLMGAYTGRKAVKTTRETMDLLEEGFEALGGAALRDYTGKAGKVLAQKETKTVAEKLTKEFDQFQDSLDNPVKKPLDKEIVEEGEKILKEVADEIGIESKGGKFSLAPEVMERVAGAARTIIKESGEKLDPNRRVSEQVYEMLRDKKIPFEVYRDVIQEFGIGVEDFAKVVLMQASEYGRGLGSISSIKADYAITSMKAIASDILAAHKKTEYELSMDAMRGLSKKSGREEPGFWLRVNNVRKGLLVSQPATAIRNGMSVGAFQAVPDIALSGFERIMAQIAGRPMKGGYISDMSALTKHVLNIGTGDKKGNLYIAQILRDLPKQQDRLFGHLFGDIANDMGAESGEGVLSKIGTGIEDGVKILNFLNRGQEHLYRSAAFLTHIERSLSRSGYDTLDDLAKKGAIRANKDSVITDKMVSDAVDFAMEFTFANNPPKTDAFGRLGNKIIDIINNSPATIAIPFPRFMFAAMRYQYEYSPAGLLHSGIIGAKKIVKGNIDPSTGKKLLGADGKPLKGRKRLQALNEKEVRDIGKGIYGSIMLGTAFELKNSEYGKDTKWYELRYDLNKPDEVIDTRALFPLPQYLFIADSINRLGSGRMKDANQFTKEFIQATTGANFRGGNVGNLAVDGLIDLATGTTQDSANLNKVYKSMLDLGSNVLSQYMQTFNIFNDVLMQYDIDEPYAKDSLGTGRTGKSQALIRDNLSSPALAKILAKLPAGLGNVLYRDIYDEERKYTIDPTLPINERVQKINPLLKQFFGLTVGKTSMVMRTLDYYGLDYGDYKFVGGDAEAQRQLNHYLQRVINFHLPHMLADSNSPFNLLVEQANNKARIEGTDVNYIKVKGFLREELKGYREKATAMLESENPALLDLWREPKRTSSIERTIMDYDAGEGAYEQRLDTIASAAERTVTKDLKFPKEPSALGFTPKADEDIDNFWTNEDQSRYK
tara:strand:+ start:2969 stop:6607 length:3639 start_codon:yes stop_codon:yes gene_type:complete